MKSVSILFLLAFCAISIFTACGNDGDAARDAAVESVATPADGTAAPAATPATPPPNAEPAQNAAGVWHYTCPKGCEGGAGTATACAKCGTTLAHNTAYHAGANTPTATPPAGNGQAVPPITPVTPPTAEPAQNAAGVWHYTCPDGCAGGAGSAVACSKCGKTLAHNQAYHQ